jgi:SHS2 domain-containing protein
MEMEKNFELIEHTADIGVVAYGASLKQAFANAARGMFSIITDLDKVVEVLHRDIELTESDQETLLVAWLNELVYIFDVEHILFKRFEITELDETRLKARGYGEKVDSARHELKMGIKATTYHILRIDKIANNSYRVQVLFDI